MAKEKGFYKQIGLDVELKEFNQNTKIIDDVLKDKSTFGISSSSLILEKLNNKPVVLLASYFKQNVLALAVKKNIKSLKDLKGKKIMALDWEMEHTSIGAMFKDAKIKNSDYTLIPHDFKVDKFISGEVDAMTIFTTSQPFLLDQAKVQYNIINPATYGIYSYDVELFTSDATVKNNPKMVQEFIEATKKGWEYALNHKTETVNIIYEKYSKEKSKKALMYEAEATEELFKRDIFSIGAVVPELIGLNTGMYAKLGLINSSVSIEDVLKDYNFNTLKTISQTINLTNEEKLFLQKYKTIKVHNEKDWAPYNYNIDNTPQGYSIDYMNLLAKRLGVNVEYISGYNWNEYIKMLKMKKIDVMLNIASTPQRNSHFIFTTPCFKSIDTIFVRKDHTSNYKNLSDFNGKRLGVTKGFYEEELLKKYYPKIKVIPFDTTLDHLKALAFGKVDGVIDSLSVAQFNIERHAISNIAPIAEVDDKRFNLALNLATHKENPMLRDILEKAKKSLTQEELITLNNKWFGEKRSTNKNNKILPFTPMQSEYIKDKKVISMCVDPDWFPYEKINTKGEHEGISADLLKLVGERTGLEFRLFKTTNWDESIEASKKGLCDILSFVNQTPKREEWLRFTEPIFQDKNVIITHEKHDFIFDLSKIYGETVVLPKGTSIEEKVRVDFPNLKIVLVESEKECFEMVSNKEADMTIRSMIVSGFTIKEENFFNLKIAGQVEHYTNNLRIAINKNENPLLDEILNSAVASITQEEKDKIVNKYISIKMEEGINLWLIIRIVAFGFLVIAGIIYWNRRLSLLNKELSLAREKALEATEAKSNFLANMSHEIRTPMNAILGMIYILKGTPLDQKQGEYLGKIELASNTLLKLINDILDFSKIEAKKLIFNKEIFTIQILLIELENVVKIKADEKGLNLRFEVDKMIPKELYGDSLRLMQVLINLISNGIKFTDQGEIVLSIQRIDTNLYKFCVQDTGIGLDSSQIENLFEPFTQADESITRKYGGTGLGLSISKQLVELMGGTITIKSQLGKGSSFEFVLPLQEAVHSSNISEESIQNTLETLPKKEKIILSLEEKQLIFEELRNTLKKKRPALCETIIEKLSQIQLNQNEQLIYDEVVKLVKQYKFKEAEEVFLR